MEERAILAATIPPSSLLYPIRATHEYTEYVIKPKCVCDDDECMCSYGMLSAMLLHVFADAIRIYKEDDVDLWIRSYILAFAVDE